jgi:hypothetical protein
MATNSSCGNRVIVGGRNRARILSSFSNAWMLRAPLVSRRYGRNAFFDNTSVMLTGVNFPTEGCWKVTN